MTPDDIRGISRRYRLARYQIRAIRGKDLGTGRGAFVILPAVALGVLGARRWPAPRWDPDAPAPGLTRCFRITIERLPREAMQIFSLCIARAVAGRRLPLWRTTRLPIVAALRHVRSHAPGELQGGPPRQPGFGERAVAPAHTTHVGPGVGGKAGE